MARIARFLAAAAASGAAATLIAQTSGTPDWSRIDAETLQRFQALVRLDTSNPPGNEKLATDYLKTVFDQEGIAVQLFALEPNRPNLVARLKGSGRKRPILLMGHTDVVTVDAKKWTTFGPFSAARDGGYIYGRGTLDDKPHVVAGLMTLLTLKRMNVPLDRDVIFLAESGEEGTSRVGADFMAQHFDAIDAEYCLAEGGGITRIDGRAKYASVQTIEKLPRPLELTAKGTSGHASRPLQDNAIVHLAAAVATIGAWRAPIRLNETTSEYFTRLAEISTAEEADRYRSILVPGSPKAAAADEYFAARESTHAAMLRTSVSPTIISGGYRVNVIPSEAKATLDVRLMPGEDAARFLQTVKSIINDPSVEVAFSRATDLRPPASRTARLDSEAFTVIQSAIRKHYDAPVLPTLGTGATDMAQMRAKGVECYGISPASDREDAARGFGAHSDQERILESELYRYVRWQWEVVTELVRAR